MRAAAGATDRSLLFATDTRHGDADAAAVHRKCSDGDARRRGRASRDQREAEERRGECAPFDGAGGAATAAARRIALAARRTRASGPHRYDGHVGTGDVAGDAECAVRRHRLEVASECVPARDGRVDQAPFA
jgi:hypothetical protein